MVKKHGTKGVVLQTISIVALIWYCVQLALLSLLLLGYASNPLFSRAQAMILVFGSSLRVLPLVLYWFYARRALTVMMRVALAFISAGCVLASFLLMCLVVINEHEGVITLFRNYFWESTIDLWPSVGMFLFLQQWKARSP